jgi:hypothetical protein
MIALRRSHPVWRHGSFDTLRTDDEQRVYVYARIDGESRAVVAVNAGSSAVRVVVALGAVGGGATWRVVHPIESSVKPNRNGDHAMLIPALSGVVFLSEGK